MIIFTTPDVWAEVFGANFEFDLKKVTALSTLRQLRLMIMTISIGLFGLVFFLSINLHIV